MPKTHISSRVRARESFIRVARDQGDVAVNCAPLAVEKAPDDIVNGHFWHAASKQAHNIPAPLVNLRLGAFEVRHALAAPDHWWFRVRHKSGFACDRRDRRDTRPASVTSVTSVTG
jgi:hypothetical protein